MNLGKKSTEHDQITKKAFENIMGREEDAGSIFSLFFIVFYPYRKKICQYEIPGILLLNVFIQLFSEGCQ